MHKPASVIQYYTLCNRLKDVIRTGWGEWDVQRARIESVAEHIYGTQMLAIAMASEYQYDLDLQCRLYDEEGCVDLRNGTSENISSNPKVKALLDSDKSWSEMWLTYGQQVYPYDQNFREVSDYAMTHRIS